MGKPRIKMRSMKENTEAERAGKIYKLTGLRDPCEDNRALLLLGGSDISKAVLEEEGFKFSGKVIPSKSLIEFCRS